MLVVPTLSFRLGDNGDDFGANRNGTKNVGARSALQNHKITTVLPHPSPSAATAMAPVTIDTVDGTALHLTKSLFKRCSPTDISTRRAQRRDPTSLRDPIRRPRLSRPRNATRTREENVIPHPIIPESTTTDTSLQQQIPHLSPLPPLHHNLPSKPQHRLQLRQRPARNPLLRRQRPEPGYLYERVCRVGPKGQSAPEGTV